MGTFAPGNGSQVTGHGCLPVDATSLANQFSFNMFYDKLAGLNGHYINTSFTLCSLVVVRPSRQTIISRIKNLRGVKTW
jgi:hypothetical protein